jgi:hypothetical protein
MSQSGKGGKLQPRWHAAPEIVEDIMEDDDMVLVYVRRNGDDLALKGVSCERTTMALPFVSTNSIGQRAFHLAT